MGSRGVGGEEWMEAAPLVKAWALVTCSAVRLLDQMFIRLRGCGGFVGMESPCLMLGRAAVRLARRVVIRRDGRDISDEWRRFGWKYVRESRGITRDSEDEHSRWTYLPGLISGTLSTWGGLDELHPVKKLRESTLKRGFGPSFTERMVPTSEQIEQRRKVGWKMAEKGNVEIWFSNSFWPWRQETSHYQRYETPKSGAATFPAEWKKRERSGYQREQPYLRF
jgi:hypothetical protein